MKPGSRAIEGAAALGVKLDVDGDDLVYDARYEVAPSVLSKIAEHESEIVATLRGRRESIAALWPQLRDLDPEQLTAFLNAKIEEIEIFKAVREALETTSVVILPIMRKNMWSWGRAAEWLMSQGFNTRYANRRPKGYSDEEWIYALNQARSLGFKAPPEKQPVSP